MATIKRSLNNRTCEAPYLIFLGPPGSGKGTQAEKLHQNFRLVQLSTGNLFREHIKNETPLGLRVKDILAKGELVPDDLTVEMVMERLARPDTIMGVVFDGFPRTRDQAVALQNRLDEKGKCVTAAISFQISDEELVERLGARQMCPKDHSTYNLKSNPPREEGKCDLCGSPLIGRDDDKPEVVRNRLRVYRQQTEPLIEFYREQDMLIEIDASRAIEEIEAQLDEWMPMFIQGVNE
ncbi:MAG: adenylate kinase [Chloroflexi bacterium]|nr:adenylate kinase [Chloroflexota bacterium]